MKSSVRYNEKREVKIRQLTEIEDTQEVTTEIQNLNREITANYFYYQLFREYKVMTELAEVRPVLLRTRDVPGPAEIDEKFLANYAHILLLELPRQLSVDLQETVGEIEILGRTMVRRRSESDAKAAAYEQFMKTAMPSDAEAQNRWRTELATRESAASDARDAFITAEENYIRARTRIDRVISHVRENLLYYMQRIWHASPTVDQDKLLQGEKFNNEYLDQQTLGFSRLGYYGNEEIRDVRLFRRSVPQTGGLTDRATGSRKCTRYAPKPFVPSGSSSANDLALGFFPNETALLIGQ